MQELFRSVQMARYVDRKIEHSLRPTGHTNTSARPCGKQGRSEAQSSEVELQRKLNLPRGNSWRLRRNNLTRRDRSYGRQRHAFVELVDDVEGLGSELDVQPFRNLRVFQNGEVEIQRIWARHAVPLHVADEALQGIRVAGRIEPLDVRTAGSNGLIDNLVRMATGRKSIVRTGRCLTAQI